MREPYWVRFGTLIHCVEKSSQRRRVGHSRIRSIDSYMLSMAEDMGVSCSRVVNASELGQRIDDALGDVVKSTDKFKIWTWLDFVPSIVEFGVGNMMKNAMRRRRRFSFPDLWLISWQNKTNVEIFEYVSHICGNSQLAKASPLARVLTLCSAVWGTRRVRF